METAIAAEGGKTLSAKQVKAFGTEAATAPLNQLNIQRRKPTTHDVEIEILYCGVCHSDLHTARNEWHGTVYPCVPGHEIVGRIVSVGDHVKKFKVGDLAAVGCMVDSCRECDYCKEGLEQYCEEGNTLTYNSPDIHLGGHTYGGYSESVVVNENYVLRVPDNLDLAATAPLLCAGITTYSPLKHWNIGPGKKVGIVGIGGLGHMGVKLAASLGAEVTVWSRSPEKEKDARRLGAHEFVLTNNPATLEALAGRYDAILDTISARHDLSPALNCLKPHGTLMMVGASPEGVEINPFPLLFGGRKIVGSLVGGIPETQEVLDFCAERGIAADVETIPVQEVDRAYDRMLKGDVRYRFSIDATSLRR